MTRAEYVEQATKHATILRSLIQNFHPATPDGPRRGIGPITAGAAEAACENVRRDIADKERDMGNPVERFDKALKDGDVLEIDSLLNSAWFGVPESINCWKVAGFKEAVDLMDDPPEDEDAK